MSRDLLVVIVAFFIMLASVLTIFFEPITLGQVLASLSAACLALLINSHIKKEKVEVETREGVRFLKP